MVRICDESFELSKISYNDLFISTVGYEERSTYLIDEMEKKLWPSNILVFCFSDLANQDRILSRVRKLQTLGVSVEFVRYEESERVYSLILSFLKTVRKPIENVYIDYSAMPRTWYSKLPINLSAEGVYAKFLYVVGEYPRKESEYPCAGINDSFSVIGKPSLRNSSCLHVIGIGYDSTRTMGLISMLDPDAYAICSARHSSDNDMEEKVQRVNRSTIDQSLFFCSFLMDEFSYMVDKLCEIAYEYSVLGDVIFVPDGPKPLIMAMSLVPQIVCRDGVVCVHVSRNPKGYEFVNVLPTKRIICFSVDNSVTKD